MQRKTLLKDLNGVKITKIDNSKKKELSIKLTTEFLNSCDIKSLISILEELSSHDIFEDVGPYLGEIRVKEVQKKGEL